MATSRLTHLGAPLPSSLRRGDPRGRRPIQSHLGCGPGRGAECGSRPVREKSPGQAWIKSRTFDSGPRPLSEFPLVGCGSEASQGAQGYLRLIGQSRCSRLGSRRNKRLPSSLSSACPGVGADGPFSHASWDSYKRSGPSAITASGVQEA